MKSRLIAVCVVAALALAACSSGDSSRDPAGAALTLPEPGQCIAKEVKDLDGVAPDYSSVTSCKKPHVYEIVDVLNVPKSMLTTGSHEARLEQRNELAKSTASGRRADEFHAYADRSCRASVLRATQLDFVRIGRKSARAADVRPVLLGARMLAHVGPADPWAAGKPTIVCSVRYADPAAPAGPAGRTSAIQSPSSVPIYLDLLSEYFPAERRACGSYNSDNYMYAVLCSYPHNTEALFSYDAAAAFGEDFADSVDDEDPTDAQWDKLVAPCEESLVDVVGTDIDEDLVGSVYLSDAWHRTHLAICLITPLSDKLDLPPGSVVGQAGVVKEVPATKGPRLGPYAKGV